jgi:hypothetical protein
MKDDSDGPSIDFLTLSLVDGNETKQEGRNSWMMVLGVVARHNGDAKNEAQRL